MPTATKPKKASAKKSDTAASDKKSTKKAAAKSEGGEGKGSKRKFGDLTQNEMKVLEALEDGTQMSRAMLTEKTGIQKGWAKMLGAASKGEVADDTLEGRGYVKHEKLEAQGEGEDKTRGGLFYTITKAGIKALDNARKEKDKAEADEE